MMVMMVYFNLSSKVPPPGEKICQKEPLVCVGRVFEKGRQPMFCANVRIATGQDPCML